MVMNITFKIIAVSRLDVLLRTLWAFVVQNQIDFSTRFGYILATLIIFFFPCISEAKELSSQIINQVKKSVVSIRTNTLYSAYENVGESGGSGFVIDKARGIVVTNKHVISPASVSTYEVTFNEGIKKDALLLYYSQWVDIAFLKVNPSDIPIDVKAVKLTNVLPKIDESIFIIGKNSGEDFSLQTGSISNLYDESESLCSQVFRISLNVHGGASGSPALNYKGQVIGIINSSNRRTTAWAIPINYVSDIYYSFLQKNLYPTEKSIGVFFRYYPLDYALKFTNFSENIASKYKQKHPEAFNRVLRIEHILPGSPTEEFLRVGDIVWRVNGIEIGPDLHKLQREIARSDKVEIEVYRNNELMNFEVPTYNAEENKIDRILSFGGGIFYEADEMTRFLSGIKSKALMLTNLSDGSSFNKLIKFGQYKDMGSNIPALFITPLSIGTYNISNLEELTMAVAQITKDNSQYFSMRYKDYSFKRLNLDSYHLITIL